MMTFTLDTWKERAGEQLRQLGGWLARRKTRDVPYLLYGGLCGLSLWPLVEAAQGGQVLPALVALGSVAGGVGGNLLAEQVQRWKDQADQAAVSEWVAAHAATDPALRAALDAILARLDAVAQAQAGLNEAERGWFVATLRQELSQLGNLARFEATLSGPGAIAQGAGARAVGQEGVLVEGDVGGDVVTGRKITLFDQRGQQVGTQINVAGDYVAGRPTGDPPASTPTSSDAGLAEGWNTEALRDLLTAAFSDGELTTLCFDHFRPVYEAFGAGMSKRDKIQRLLDYCLRQGQVERLLAQVQKRNPAQYARFAARLKG